MDRDAHDASSRRSSHDERGNAGADDANEQRKPVPEPRQAEIGGDVVEFETVARGDKALPRHDGEHDDREHQRRALEQRHHARREIVDRIDDDVFVAQEHAGQRDEERAGEQQLDQIVDAADRHS